MNTQILHTLKQRILNEREQLAERLEQLSWLERLWDERVTRLLADHPAKAGDCAWHRDCARDRAVALQRQLFNFELALTRLPA